MNDPDFRLSFEHLEEYVPARRNIWVGSKREVLAIPSRGVPRLASSLDSAYLSFAEPKPNSRAALHRQVIKVPDCRPSPDSRFLLPEDWVEPPRSQSTTPTATMRTKTTWGRTCPLVEMRKRLHPRAPVASLFLSEFREYPRTHDWYKPRSKAKNVQPPTIPTAHAGLNESGESGSSFMLPYINHDEENGMAVQIEFIVEANKPHKDHHSSSPASHRKPRHGHTRTMRKELDHGSKEHHAMPRGASPLTPVLTRRKLQSFPEGLTLARKERLLAAIGRDGQSCHTSLSSPIFDSSSHTADFRDSPRSSPSLLAPCTRVTPLDVERAQSHSLSHSATSPAASPPPLERPLERGRKARHQAERSNAAHRPAGWRAEHSRAEPSHSLKSPLPNSPPPCSPKSPAGGGSGAIRRTGSGAAREKLSSAVTMSGSPKESKSSVAEGAAAALEAAARVSVSPWNAEEPGLDASIVDHDPDLDDLESAAASPILSLVSAFRERAGVEGPREDAQTRPKEEAEARLKEEAARLGRGGQAQGEEAGRDGAACEGVRARRKGEGTAKG